MNIGEFASEYMRLYDDTDVTISAVTEHDGAGCVAFDTSDGRHWLGDDSDIGEAETSLCDGEVVWGEDDYLFIPGQSYVWDDDADKWVNAGQPQKINWVL